MPAVFAALSLTDQVEKYGAYAGIAAIVGLGVLALLYISQAREVKRLREWAGRAPERDAELQQRVVAEAQRRAAAPRPVPAPPAAPAGGTAPGAWRPAAAQQPAAAPSEATQVLGPAVTPAVTPAAARPLAPGPGTPAAAAAAAAAARERVAGSPSPPPAGSGAAGGPAPAAPLGSPGPAAPAPAVPPATAAGAASPNAGPASPAGPWPVPSPGPAPRPRAAARVDGREAVARDREAGSGGSRRAIAAVVLAAIAIAAVAVLLITQVLGGESPAPQRPNTVEPVSEPAGDQSATRSPSRARTAVAVLNGTTVTGLARAAADKLQAGGYREVGPVTTDTSNQARAATAVYFEPGARREAQDAARLLGIDRAALQPMTAIDPGARALAAGAPVVVIVGADQAR